MPMQRSAVSVAVHASWCCWSIQRLKHEEQQLKTYGLASVRHSGQRQTRNARGPHADAHPFGRVGAVCHDAQRLRLAATQVSVPSTSSQVSGSRHCLPLLSDNNSVRTVAKYNFLTPISNYRPGLRQPACGQIISPPPTPFCYLPTRDGQPNCHPRPQGQAAHPTFLPR